MDRGEISFTMTVDSLQANHSFLRAEHAHLDETAIVADLLKDRIGASHVMLDIGAHVGSSTAYFLALGWTVHCFEPDAANRAVLEARFSGCPQVSIDPRALSETPQSGVSFFTSIESTGISGLHAFADSHEATSSVEVTTLAIVAEEMGVDRVDFLKIDVEGFDLAVLRGAPWDRWHPDVVECEFEDAKTLKLGHSWRDIAAFLETRGYAVYVSEWHPVLQYGLRHDWRALARFPEARVSDDSWGNLLAFREDPGLAEVCAAFARALAQQDAMDTNVPPTRRAWYAPIAEHLRSASPVLFRTARQVKRSLWGTFGR